MKFLSTFVLLATLSVFAEAASLHDHVGRSNHNSISRRANRNTRRCRSRPGNTVEVNTTESKNDVPKKDEPKKDEPKKDEPKKDEPKKDEPKKDPAPNTGGLIKAQDSSCGPVGATENVTPLTGPNGSFEWMTCGIEGAGWNPPFVGVNDLVTVDLDYAISQNGPFASCGPHAWAFKQFGGEFQLPPILLAAIALQESSCNPYTVGGAGEQGLMQITPEKCDGAPGGDCMNVGFNVQTGARYLRTTLDANGGSFFLALGTYNGWKPGMTVGSATSAANCHWHNDLDYLIETVNGWILNLDPNSLRLGKYHNRENCH